jgi:hypothetical protein
MGVRRRRPYRRWPIWLLLAALLLLVLGVLLMHRSYRAQLDASMARLQQSVAAAQAQQARLAASIRAARAAVAVQHDDRTDLLARPPSNDLTSADASRIATRLQSIANELDQLVLSEVPGRAQVRGDHQQGPGSWLDWRQVRKAVRELAHAVRQHWLISSHRSGPLSNAQQQAVRGWLQRTRIATGQADAPALAQALAAIEQLLTADARDDPAAGQLARRATLLRSVLSASPLSERERRRLARLAEQISVIARQLEPGPGPSLPSVSEDRR